MPSSRDRPSNRLGWFLVRGSHFDPCELFLWRAIVGLIEDSGTRGTVPALGVRALVERLRSTLRDELLILSHDELVKSFLVEQLLEEMRPYVKSRLLRRLVEQAQILKSKRHQWQLAKKRLELMQQLVI